MRAANLLLVLSVSAFAQTPLMNPAAWPASDPSAYPARSVTQGCPSMPQCTLLAYSGTLAPHGSSGRIWQTVNALPYRGKKIRFRASIRAEVKGSQNHAHLWVKVERRSGAAGFTDDMSDRPITSSVAQAYQIVGDIDEDADGIFLGLSLAGEGRVWMDAASFDVLGDADMPAPPRPLTARGLENLQALARLFGFVRFFHPSDEAAAANWNAVLASAIPRVEAAASAQELCTRLRAIFEPLAPTVQIFPTGDTPPSLAVHPESYIVYWEHHGIGFTPGGDTYYSRRITVPAVQGAARLTPFRATLPGGVDVLVPTALYRETAAAPAPASLLPGRAGSGDDRTTRLAAVMFAWNIPQHFYPYFDVVPADWPAALSDALSAAARDVDALAFLQTLRRMIAALHDGHGSVMEPGDNVATPDVVWTWAENRIVALRANPATGIHPGDALVSVDGTPAAEFLAGRAASISGATPQWIRFVALRSLLVGRRGSAVRVEIEPHRTLTLTRDSGLGPLLADTRPAQMQELKPGIFYVDLDRLDDAALNAALPTLAAAKGIVFDFRGYPGQLHNVRAFFSHMIDKHSTSAQFLVPIFTRPDREDMTMEPNDAWQMDPIAPRLIAKMVFLTDGRAISAAESCMGVVEAYKLGEILGESTAGTNGGINPFTVPGGYVISWTGMKVLKHDGSQHHGVGIQPTIPVALTRAGIAAGRDEVLERALGLFK